MPKKKSTRSRKKGANRIGRTRGAGGRFTGKPRTGRRSS